MKNFSVRYSLSLRMLLLGSFVFCGCSSNPEAKPGGDEMNKGMSAQQKAITADHKNKAEQ